MAFAAKGVNDSLTNNIKDLSDRKRPNNPTDTESFPSSHTSNAFTYRAITSRNLDFIDLHPGVEVPARIAVGAMAVATGWARVEGGNHYPRDVLVGAALGNFVTTFVYEAFLGLPDSLQVTASVGPHEDEVVLGLTWTP